MKILLAIAYHGTKNRPYLDRVLRQYKSMPFEVHPVLFCEVAKDLGPDVEVKVGAPTEDPWSLPFPHKQLFAERINDYDLFIYSEDDILITQENINAFLKVSEVLEDGEVPGFLRTEQTPEGRVSFPEAHGYFHWVAESLRKRGPYQLAGFSNDHAGCYMLTRGQLKKAIDSGGFVVGPHDERYDLLVTAATDPYTQCGLEKLICISHLKDFVIPHLSNRYAGIYGMEAGQMQLQVARMIELLGKGQSVTDLISTESQLPRLVFSKDYYEPVRHDLLPMIPANAMNILSVGCGTGETEGYLVQQGKRVTAIPLDPIIGAVAGNKGVRMVCGDLPAAKAQLKDERFDCILCTGILPLCNDPVAMLHSMSQLLNKNGLLVVSVPNMNHHKALMPRLRGQAGFRDVGNYQRAGIHKSTRRQLRAWFKQAGLVVDQMSSRAPVKHKWVYRLGGTLGAELTGLDVISSARCKNPTTSILKPVLAKA